MYDKNLKGPRKLLEYENTAIVIDTSWFFFKNIYLFILAAPGFSCGMRDLHCGMQTLSCGLHVGSSSPTRDRTRAPSTGSTESYPLDCQGSPVDRYKVNVQKSIVSINASNS